MVAKFCQALNQFFTLIACWFSAIYIISVEERGLFDSVVLDLPICFDINEAEYQFVCITLKLIADMINLSQ